MQFGLDQLPAELAREFRGAQLGLVCHAASQTTTGIHAVEYLAPNTHWRLAALFGPEHGLAGLAADMESVGDQRHPTLHIPVYSLYGSSLASLAPQRAWLEGLDLVVIDLQDIGTRYYTYIYTMANCMRVCHELGIAVVVCDRPNPINGLAMEGGLVAPGFASFVGQYPLPIRHGLTIGEFARFVHCQEGWTNPLTIIAMHGWNRAWHWDNTGVTWRNPSPNMRSLEAAMLYPGLCLLEATNISEGRGTASPFELCGAPWIDAHRLATELASLQIPGIRILPTQFVPASRKFAGQTCHGLQLAITDREKFQPYRFGLALVWAMARHHQEKFQWRTPDGNPPHSGLDAGPYEFVTDKPAIDLLTGGNTVRQAIDENLSWTDLEKLAGSPPDDFLTARKQALLY